MTLERDRETEKMLQAAAPEWFLEGEKASIEAPSSLCYEDMLVGAILTWRYDIPTTDVPALQQALAPDDFSSTWHQVVALAGITLWLEGRMVDWVQIAHMIGGVTGNTVAGDLMHMEACMRRNGIPGNEMYYVHKIHAYAHARRLQVALLEAADRLSVLDRPYTEILEEIKTSLRDAIRYTEIPYER